ncbi:Hypothetical protein FKW44_007019 [Caligus rogercresseyi]|uniref:Uncharacterized protein n=1 Tax=Caligus rogercresseyi TaxID=217165 RepID=A0A7T8QTA4_CALRO|nr:Hypothetical protein FKW44_007019 [Caligus rogercresseyi]
MALEVGVNREMMRKIVREDLGVKPYHLQKQQLLSDATVDKRLGRSKVVREFALSGRTKRFSSFKLLSTARTTAFWQKTSGKCL